MTINEVPPQPKDTQEVKTGFRDRFFLYLLLLTKPHERGQTDCSLRYSAHFSRTGFLDRPAQPLDLCFIFYEAKIHLHRLAHYDCGNTGNYRSQ